MYKKLALTLALLSTSWISQANLIQNITGADMAGIVVTVTNRNGGITSAIWDTTGSESGEASFFNKKGNGWSLDQVGDTIGENDPSVSPGYWTLTSTGVNIRSLLIEGLYGNILFDNLFGDDNVNGSGAGREFTYDTTSSTVTAAFLGQYQGQPDLYRSMLLTGQNPRGNGSGTEMLLGANGSLQFLIDTDIIEVPEPGTVFLLMSGLLGLMISRKKRAEK
jgi:hypothetical protein